MKVKGLYFIWSHSEETPYLEAVSYSVQTLQEIQESIKDKECFQDGRFEIREVPVYIARMKNKKIKLSMINSSQIYSIYGDTPNYLYCMNMTPELRSSIIYPNTCDSIISSSTSCNKINDDGIIDQVLLMLMFTYHTKEEYADLIKTARNSEVFLENDFSENPIEFDKYYDEGVINA